MQANNIIHKNNYNISISFKAGLTPKIMKDIQAVNPTEISQYLSNKEIVTNFQDNKIIAWCCAKVVEIIEYINNHYNQKLSLPKGIFVENFNNLKIPSTNIFGFCNLQPVKLYHNNEVIPSRVLFFNSFKNKNDSHLNWNNLDTISDNRFLEKQSGTDYFLDIFLHEFFHASHEDRLINKLGSRKLAKLFKLLNDDKFIEEYPKKFGLKISQICDYALINPMEAVACDMSRITVNSLNKETLLPESNPFIGTPYEKLSFWKRINIPYYQLEEKPLIEILRDFWNGKFC